MASTIESGAAASSAVTSGRAVASPSRVGRDDITLALVALAIGHFAVDSCTGIWPVYKTLAGLELVSAGFIATLGGVVGNALQLLFGPLADRGLRRWLLVGGVLASSAVLAVGISDRFLVHLLLVLSTSVASAAFHPAAAGAAGALTRSRQGFVVAVFLVGGYVGFAFSQLAFAAAWRWAPAAPLALALVPVIAAVLLARLPAEAPRAAASHGTSWRGAWQQIAPLFAIQALTSAVGVALIFLLPDLMAAHDCPSWMVQGGGHAALVLGGALSLLPGGALADRFGARRVLAITNLVAVGLLALLGLAHLGSWSVLGLVTLFGFFNSANNVVVVAEGNRTLPGQASAVSSVLMGLPWCLAALTPSLAGILADPATGGTPERALVVIGLALPVAIVTTLGVARRPAARA